MSNSRDILKHIVIISSITAVLLLLFFSMILPWLTHHNEKIIVPDLSGKTLEEASSLLSSKSLSSVVSDSVYMPGALPGSIVNQNPIPGSAVKSDRKIYLVQSTRKPPMIVIPDWKDKSLTSVRNELHHLGFKIGNIRFVSGTFENMVKKLYAVDTVSLIPGATLAAGTVINLEVEHVEE